MIHISRTTNEPTRLVLSDNSHGLFPVGFPVSNNPLLFYPLANPIVTSCFIHWQTLLSPIGHGTGRGSQIEVDNPGRPTQQGEAKAQ